MTPLCSHGGLSSRRTPSCDTPPVDADGRGPGAFRSTPLAPLYALAADVATHPRYARQNAAPLAYRSLKSGVRLRVTQTLPFQQIPTPTPRGLLLVVTGAASCPCGGCRQANKTSSAGRRIAHATDPQVGRSSSRDADIAPLVEADGLGLAGRCNRSYCRSLKDLDGRRLAARLRPQPVGQLLGGGQQGCRYAPDNIDNKANVSLPSVTPTMPFQPRR